MVKGDDTENFLVVLKEKKKTKTNSGCSSFQASGTSPCHRIQLLVIISSELMVVLMFLGEYPKRNDFLSIHKKERV